MLGLFSVTLLPEVIYSSNVWTLLTFELCGHLTEQGLRYSFLVFISSQSDPLSTRIKRFINQCHRVCWTVCYKKGSGCRDTLSRSLIACMLQLIGRRCFDIADSIFFKKNPAAHQFSFFLKKYYSWRDIIGQEHWK